MTLEFRVIPRMVILMTDTAPEAATVEDIDEIDELDELDCLKIETLADLWEVSKRTIEKLIYDGELDSHKVGFNRRIRRQDALAYLERTRVSKRHPVAAEPF